MTRPTILQIIPELDTGGAELSAVEIAAAVVNAGGRALVLSEGGRLVARLETAGGEFVPFPAATKNPAVAWWNSRRIQRMIEAENVRLVHARSRAPAWSALLAARAAKVPFVTTYHGAYNETNAAKKFYNSVMSRGDLVIANSRYTADLVRKRYATPEARIRVIHRGVDTAAFDPGLVSADRVAKLRAQWQLQDGDLAVLHAARLTGWKGQRVIINAARLLRDSGRLGRAVFILAGDDQGRHGYRAELEHQIAAAGLEGRVRLVGHVEDIPAAFAAAHLGVVPSTEPEAFGRAAAESQAMACPVIAANHGAPAETVLTGPGSRTGWLAAPGDAGATADALAEALALTSEERGEIGARARAHVLASFTLDRMRRDTLRVYDELLGTSLAQALDGAA